MLKHCNARGIDTTKTRGLIVACEFEIREGDVFYIYNSNFQIGL